MAGIPSARTLGYPPWPKCNEKYAGDGPARQARSLGHGAAPQSSRMRHHLLALSIRERSCALDLRAIHDAPRVIVERIAPMHRAAVVPHDQVADAPAVRVDELALRRVLGEFVQQGLCVGIGHPADRAPGE